MPSDMNHDIREGILKFLDSVPYLIGQLRRQIACDDISQVIEAGALLWTISDRASKALAIMKIALREDAIGTLHGPGTKHFKGMDRGSASVTIPTPVMVIKPSDDMARLRRILGDVYDDIIEEKCEYHLRKGADDVIGGLSPEQQEALFEVLIITENKPRVSFKMG